ncbi:hypothetical protein JOD15_003245, partial [Enterococcus ureilyticus]|nr:hypothetical protein [Enterococcus ureilyticus]
MMCALKVVRRLTCHSTGMNSVLNRTHTSQFC